MMAPSVESVRERLTGRCFCLMHLPSWGWVRCDARGFPFVGWEDEVIVASSDDEDKDEDEDMGSIFRSLTTSDCEVIVVSSDDEDKDEDEDMRSFSSLTTWD